MQAVRVTVLATCVYFNMMHLRLTVGDQLAPYRRERSPLTSDSVSVLSLSAFITIVRHPMSIAVLATSTFDVSTHTSGSFEEAVPQATVGRLIIEPSPFPCLMPCLRSLSSRRRLLLTDFASLQTRRLHPPSTSGRRQCWEQRLEEANDCRKEVDGHGTTLLRATGEAVTITHSALRQCGFLYVHKMRGIHFVCH